MMLTRRKSASRGGYATSHSLQQLCAQTTCQRSCFCKHRCNLWCLCSSESKSQPHQAPNSIMLQEKQQKDLLCLLSILTLLLLSASCQNWGSHCLRCCKFPFQVVAALVLLAVLSHTSMPWALQLRYWGAGSALALQAKHSWGGKTTWRVWNSPTSLLRDVTMRILCWADFCHFGGWGCKAALVHCDCLDIVLRASMGRNCFWLRRD